jgi:hypothetical protein
MFILKIRLIKVMLARKQVNVVLEKLIKIVELYTCNLYVTHLKSRTEKIIALTCN